MKPDDGLPDKICLKCMKILKYAVYFRKTCKLSDANLKSVIQRAKSATNIFKQEWAKEPTADESISYDDDDDIDDALTSIALNGEEEEQEKETSDPCIKRKVDHQELPIHKKFKVVIDTNVQNSIQEKSEKLTPKYDSDQCSSRDVITYDDNELDLESDLDNVVEEMKLITKPEDADISNSSRMINEETPLQENNEDHIHASALDVYNNSHVNLESNSNQNLVEKIMDEQDLGIGEIGEHIEDEEDIEPIGEEENENKTALYYIINDVKGDVHNDTETNEHFHEQHVHASDDNVDFIPLDEDEDDDLQQQQQIDDIHTDMDDNQSHVTSTVVTKDELDFDTGSNSNVSQDTDSEYIIDEYVIDDGDNINQRLTSKKRQNSSGNSSNKHVQKPPVIRKQGATIIGSSTSFPIVCEICGNNFTSRQLLNVHMKIHRQEKTHECE